jgi:hypothetical protein
MPTKQTPVSSVRQKPYLCTGTTGGRRRVALRGILKKASVFPEDLAPAGKPIPWSEWDFTAPVSTYIIHFDQAQIDLLWKEATKGVDGPSDIRISKHDAILAHVWSCIVRARQLGDDPTPVHCDLVLGVRPALKLSEAFMGVSYYHGQHRDGRFRRGRRW